MSQPNVRGIVHLIEPTKTYGQKGFRKRLVVLEQDKGSFTNFIPVDFIQDSCDSADQLTVGDDVEITYRLAGRKWQRDPDSEVKYFLNAEAEELKIVTKAAGEKAAVAVGGDEGGGEEEVPF